LKAKKKQNKPNISIENKLRIKNKKSKRREKLKRNRKIPSQLIKSLDIERISCMMNYSLKKSKRSLQLFFNVSDILLKITLYD
jgi:hypothetical protein